MRPSTVLQISSLTFSNPAELFSRLPPPLSALLSHYQIHTAYANQVQAWLKPYLVFHLHCRFWALFIYALVMPNIYKVCWAFLRLNSACAHLKPTITEKNRHLQLMPMNYKPGKAFPRISPRLPILRSSMSNVKCFSHLHVCKTSTSHVEPLLDSHHGSQSSTSLGEPSLDFQRGYSSCASHGDSFVILKQQTQISTTVDNYYHG